jgi:hypothetical protein
MTIKIKIISVRERKYFILLIIFILSNPLFSQSPNWEWAVCAGSNGPENGSAIAADLSGNVYVTGYFYSSLVTFGTYTLTNNGNYDAFIAKYDRNGNVVWAKSIGGIYDDLGSSVAIDNNGNVVVTGSFYSPAITIGSTILNNQGVADIFVIKYDSSGNELWIKQEGGTLEENSKAITTDLNGNIYFTGFFKSSSISSGASTLTNSGSEDFFIIKYDSLGNTIWVKSATGTGKENGNALKTDSLGNLYATGFFYNTISFDTLNLTSLGSSDVFIVKYNNLGNEIWAKSFGGNLNDIGLGVSIDDFGSIYIVGSFLSYNLSYAASSLVNNGDFDIFLVKYDSFGNEIWALREGGLNEESGLGIANDKMGNVYITGHFHSPYINFGPYIFTNSGIGDCYYAKYDSGGMLQWAKSVGGFSDDGNSSISINDVGEIFVTGSFYSQNISFTNMMFTNFGSSDLFVAKMEGLTTSENLKSNAIELNFYPNPSNGEFTIKWQKEIVAVTIINQLGESVYEVEGKFLEQNKMDVRFLNKGIYTAIINSEAKNNYKKFIIN